MKIKTSDLIGAALDWAVCAADEKKFKEVRVIKWGRHEASTPAWIMRENAPFAEMYHRFSPSTEWVQGGPIGEREGMSVEYDREWVYDPSKADPDDEPDNGDRWLASIPGQGEMSQYGPTELVAKMRCYVASVLGAEVDVPEGVL